MYFFTNKTRQYLIQVFVRAGETLWYSTQNLQSPFSPFEDFICRREECGLRSELSQNSGGIWIQISGLRPYLLCTVFSGVHNLDLHFKNIYTPYSGPDSPCPGTLRSHLYHAKWVHKLQNQNGGILHQLFIDVNDLSKYQTVENQAQSCIKGMSTTAVGSCDFQCGGTDLC